MATLTLSSKAGGRNYFFGKPLRNGQSIIAQFNSAEEMHIWFSSQNNGIYVNERWIVKIIKAEYSRSATFYYRMQFDNLDLCKKVFAKHAII